MLLQMKKKSVPVLVSLVLILFFVFSKDNSWGEKTSWGLFFRLLGSWACPLILAFLWLSKDEMVSLLNKFVGYIFLWVMVVLAAAFIVSLYFGLISCDWCVGERWEEAFNFYYYLLLPGAGGIELSMSLVLLSFLSLVFSYVPERFFGRFPGKKNRALILSLLFIWVAFLPLFIQVAKKL